MNESINSLEKIVLRFCGLRAERKSSDCKDVQLKGTICIMKKWYRIDLHCPNFPTLQQMQFLVQHAQCAKQFNQKSTEINENWSVEQLISEVPNLVRIIVPSAAAAAMEEEELTCVDLYEQLKYLKNMRDVSIYYQKDLSHVKLLDKQHDGEHYVRVELPTLAVIEHSLPKCINLQQILQQCNNLIELCDKFQSLLEDLQAYYETFRAIDELCHVVSPLQPKAENWRIFHLSKRAFIKLVIEDPFAPDSTALVSIIGPTYEVEIYRRLYSEGLRNWDAELDVHKNLLRIFDLCFFPMPPTANSAAAQSEDVNDADKCPICYTYTLLGDVPIVSCDNAHCPQMYHAKCLKQWFNTIEDGRVFLDVSLGTCPFCQSKLSTYFTDLIKADQINA